MSDLDTPTDLRNARRLIIRGDGSFNADPKGDWVSARHFDAALAEIERLQKEVRLYRAGFEGALRYLAEEIYDDVRAPFDPKGKAFTPEYLNDLASMRTARAQLP